jgi:chromosome segregation protein
LYLKNITLRGFKSFAKKSQLFFEPGISVIVGPNGSGKSNIADAISWVLGEQSPKSLRGSSMEDVIFRSKQEELAIAEVSLVFDNSDKFLPIEFKEVKFARRVYSKGGSEYFINSTPCRLIDIQDITADRGIGRGLYTIINQGQINEIALLKPLERKIIIDEIIGTSKHKIRREKSKNKLLKVTNDIDRIDDLMLEVKRTMDPLEVESIKAQKYFEFLNNLKSEEISLFLSELNTLNKMWEIESNNYEKDHEKINQNNQEIQKIENKKFEYEKQINENKSKYDYLKNKIDNFNIHENKLNSTIALLESKRNVFSTLSNMFKSEYLSIKNSAINLINHHDNYADNNKKNIGNERNEEKIYKKIIDIESLINKFLEKLKKYITSVELMLEFEKDKKVIKNELYQLVKLIENKQEININDKSDINIEEKLKGIKVLQDYCLKKMLESGNILDILNNFKIVSEKIKNKLYPEFKEILNNINNENEKMNDFNNSFNSLKSLKFDLENELYKTNIRKDQIKDKVKNLTEYIIDNYNLSLEFILKNYKPSEDIEKSAKTVKKLKNELKVMGNVNPNATIEFNRVKERYNFLKSQRDDLFESKSNLEGLIAEINEKIEVLFLNKFDEIKKNFENFFKILFPLGNGELQLIKSSSEDEDYGIDLRADINSNKFVPLLLLSGGEKALISTAFLFSIFATNISPFYVFDEIDAALDDMNLARFLSLVKNFSINRQIIIITHQKKTMEIADTIYGVSMQSTGISKIISEKMENINAEVN